MQVDQPDEETVLIEDVESLVEEEKDGSPAFTGFTKIQNFNPDDDGFTFDLASAKQLHKNMNLLEFIRKRILSNKAKLFDQNVKNLNLYLR